MQSDRKSGNEPDLTIYDLLEQALDQPVTPGNSVTLRAKLGNIETNKKSRLFSNIGDVLVPHYNMHFQPDSQLILSVIAGIKAKSQEDYAITDNHTIESIKQLSKLFMYRVSRELFGSDNEVNPSKRRRLFRTTSDELTSPDILNAYFRSFMQYMLAELISRNIIRGDHPGHIALNNFINKAQTTEWAADVLAERLQFDELYNVDSKSLIAALDCTNTEQRMLEVKSWSSNIMHRAYHLLFQQNYTISKGGAIETSLKVALLLTYFNDFTNRLIATMQADGTLHQRNLHLRTRLKEAFDKSDTYAWGINVVRENSKQQITEEKKQAGLSNSELAGAIAGGLTLFGLVAGGLVALAISKKPDPHPSNNVDNSSPPPSPFPGRF